MTDVRFPQLSNDGAGETGVIVSWFVEDGAYVTDTTMVAEVAVDKVDAEVYPGTSGTITILVPEGAEVEQGASIARID